MNNSLLLVALAAVAVGLGLLLLLGSSDTASAPVVAEETVGDEGAVIETSSPQYWEPVEGVASTGAFAAVPCISHPSCSPCGSRPVATPVVVQTVRIAGGCGTPVSPCERPVCGLCERAEVACVPVAPVTECYVGGCGRPVSPCAEPTCSWPTSVCMDPCARAECERPGINRNTPACIDECGFVQLHSTAHQPICSAVRFEWAASNGTFLNPYVSDPLYFAPSVCSPYGGEVWITLVITDETGVRYTDSISLHVRNTR